MSSLAQPVAMLRGGSAASRASTRSVTSSLCCEFGYSIRFITGTTSPPLVSEFVPSSTFATVGSLQWPAVITTFDAISVPVQSA